jgi:hypothetical protein
LSLYVDNILVARSSKVFVNVLKQQISKKFSMKYLGVAKQMLGMKIIRDGKKKELILSQEKYIEKVLEIFSMKYAKAAHL